MTKSTYKINFRNKNIGFKFSTSVRKFGNLLLACGYGMFDKNIPDIGEKILLYECMFLVPNT